MCISYLIHICVMISGSDLVFNLLLCSSINLFDFVYVVLE